MNLQRSLLALAALPLLLAVAACDDPKASSAAKPAASTAAVAAYAAPATYEFDASHSTVGFSVKHMMVSNVKGTFQKFTGSLYLDEQDPAKSKLSVDVDTQSIDTRNVDRDKHLASADFFDSAKFPKMTFSSTKVERDGAGYKVTGDLTIKDVTKSVVLSVDAIPAEAKDPFVGAFHRGAHASAKIDRQDFGLKWNKAIETGGAVVGDEVTIDLDVELIKKTGA